MRLNQRSLVRVVALSTTILVVILRCLSRHGNKRALREEATDGALQMRVFCRGYIKREGIIYR